MTFIYGLGRTVYPLVLRKCAAIYGRNIKISCTRSCLAGKGDSTVERAGDLEVPESDKTVCGETELVLGYEA